MILNLVNINREASILMDSIPFEPGEFTCDVTGITTKNNVEYENKPGDKFWLTYKIPYKVTRSAK